MTVTLGPSTDSGQALLKRELKNANFCNEVLSGRIGLAILLTALLSAWCFTAPAWCAQIGITATVDKTRVTLEDSLVLSVTVSGAQNAPPPRLPPLSDFRVQSAGSSSSMRIVNGRMDMSVTHNYRLTPKAAGVFTIGPASLELAGTVYTSDPITVTVKKTSSARSGGSAPAFVGITVSNRKPYVNEQVILTFKLYRRVNAQNINLDLSYDTFRKESLGAAREYSQVINGLNYQVYELSTALFPTRPGPVEIPAAVVDLDLVYREQSRGPFDSFFSDPFFNSRSTVRHKTLRTKPIRMEVLPLPMQGRPKNFTNLVGRFQLSAALGKQSVEVGDTTTLTLTVSGAGNVQDAEMPAPAIRENFKIYPDQPQLQKSTAGNRVSGTKTFKFALVPLHEGKARIPPSSLSYFDPQKRRYVILKTKPLTLTVTPAKDAEQLKVVDAGSAPGASGDIKVLGRDILPIHTVLRDFRDQKPGGAAFYLAGFVLPVVLFLGFASYHSHQLRLREDIAFSRARQAYKKAKGKLDRLAADGDSGDFAAKLSQILREYIGDKLNLQGTAFTASEVEAKLKEKHYPETQVLSTRKLLEKFETYQYAHVQNARSDQLLDESLDVLKQLEKQP
ncbi:MAG: BatD family protein [Nitrospinales bacterium]